MQSDEAALHAAIADRPHDDTPHLVLADYYDDNGQPEKAAMHRFITDPTSKDSYRRLVAAHNGRHRDAETAAGKYAFGLLPHYGSPTMTALAAHRSGETAAARAHTALAVATFLRPDKGLYPGELATHAIQGAVRDNPRSVPRRVRDAIAAVPLPEDQPLTAVEHDEAHRLHSEAAALTAGTHPPLHVLNTVAARIHREAAARLRG